MQNSVKPSIVSPAKFLNQPQTHFARLRLNKDYEYEHNGHYATGGLQLDLTAAIEKVFAGT